MAYARLCPSCMAHLQPGDEICGNCGKQAKIANKLHHLQVGTMLNSRYLVGAVIGEGGFGITYVGYDCTLGLKVAIKEYYPNGVANRLLSGGVTAISSGQKAFAAGMGHFLREAEILSGLAGDENVVTLRDFFKTRGTAYIVMEFLEGQDLRQLSQMRGRLSYEEAMRVLEPAISCLGRIHNRGLIHGDISPSNIMLLKNGQVKILDFGTARAQGTSADFDAAMMLKPGYAAEEQYRMEGQCGPWTDVYAISATLYMMLTGITPEEAPDRLYKDQLKPPGHYGARLSGGQERALMQGLALNAKDRTQSMARLLDELKRGAKRRLMLGRGMKAAGVAAAAVAVAAAIVLAPKAGSAPAAGEVSAPAASSSVRKNRENTPAVAELCEDAYPFPVYADMEPVEDFAPQVIADNLYYTIRATDCLMGNGMLCIMAELTNLSDSETLNFSSIDLLPDGKYDLGIAMTFNDSAYSMMVPPGETLSCAYWGSTDELLLKGIRTLRGTELSTYVYMEDYSSLYKHDLMEPYIDFGSVLRFDREEGFETATLYEGELFGQDLRIDCCGAALLKDHYTGKLFFRVSLNENFRGSGSVNFRILQTGDSVDVDGSKIFTEDTYSSDSYFYISQYSNTDFGMCPISYGYSAARDEMNVLHSGLPMPTTIVLELAAEWTDYDTNETETVDLGTVTLHISEDGVGVMEKG